MVLSLSYPHSAGWCRYCSGTPDKRRLQSFSTEKSNLQLFFFFYVHPLPLSTGECFNSIRLSLERDTERFDFFFVVFLFFFISQCNWDKFCIINLKMNVKLQQALVKAVLNCFGDFFNNFWLNCLHSLFSLKPVSFPKSVPLHPLPLNSL